MVPLRKRSTEIYCWYEAINVIRKVWIRWLRPHIPVCDITMKRAAFFEKQRTSRSQQVLEQLLKPAMFVVLFGPSGDNSIITGSIYHPDLFPNLLSLA